MTGEGFLARSQEDRAHYVAGLADALADAIEARASRLAEPAARNFLWAAASLCTGP